MRTKISAIAVCAGAALGSIIIGGCGDKASDTATDAAPAPATVASPGSVTPAGQPVPGNPNPNAASNAAAFEAARKKAEGK